MAENWGFYGRVTEQAEIERIVSSGRWFFCAISGRRRIGKTTLIQRAIRSLQRGMVLYLQVPDSDERGVVQAFQDAMEDSGFKLATVQKTVRTFQDMASLIAFLNSKGWYVILDEFQYFHRKHLTPFCSHLQAHVDELRDTRTGGLFVLGSIHTEMTAILEDRVSPLFNRITHRLHLDHWDFATLFEMFEAHGVNDPSHRLFLWTLFEGVPKFYRDAFEQDVLADREGYRSEALRGLFFEGSSPLRDEATNWFLRELRGRYDSVLKLLAYKGPCSHRQLVGEYARAGSGDEKQLSAYIGVLIERYGMVDRLQPVFAPASGRKARYAISDNFLSSWLSSIARNVQMARVQPVERCVERADLALASHEGKSIEKMTRTLIQECSRKGVGDIHVTDMVRGYWNKADGSDIEIDIVAYDEESHSVLFGSCKRSAERHDDEALVSFRGHVERFLRTGEGRRFAGWRTSYQMFSPHIGTHRRQALEMAGLGCMDLNDFGRLLGRRELPLLSVGAETGPSSNAH